MTHRQLPKTGSCHQIGLVIPSSSLTSHTCCCGVVQMNKVIGCVILPTIALSLFDALWLCSSSVFNALWLCWISFKMSWIIWLFLSSSQYRRGLQWHLGSEPPHYGVYRSHYQEFAALSVPHCFVRRYYLFWLNLYILSFRCSHLLILQTRRWDVTTIQWLWTHRTTSG